MSDIYTILYAIIFSIGCDMLIKEYDISFVTVILSIIMIGIYDIIKNIKCVIKISYNYSDED